MASEENQTIANTASDTDNDNLSAKQENTASETPVAEEPSSENPQDNEPDTGGIDLEKLKKIVEGAIFAAAKPLTIDNLGALFLEDERPSKESFKKVLDILTEEYAERGVMLKEVSSGFRFQVKEDVGQWVSRLWEEKPARYSRALLETLALIAYRQPITRGEIEEIRGVSTSSHIMKTLQERDWIRIVGHRDVPGRPAMYATTRLFLDYFNLKNIDELPSLAEIRDLDEINRELDLKSDNDVANALAENNEQPGSEVSSESEVEHTQTVEDSKPETLAADSQGEDSDVPLNKEDKTAASEPPLGEAESNETN